MICNKCGMDIDETKGYCGYCGEKIEQKIKYSWNFDNNVDEKIEKEAPPAEHYYSDKPVEEEIEVEEEEVKRSGKKTALKVLLITFIVILVAAVLGFAAFFTVSKMMTKDSGDKAETTEQQTTTEKDGEKIEPQEAKDVRLECSASSTLSTSDGNTYYASNAFDGNKNTCWTEGLEGSGIGEYISVEFSDPITIDKIGILNGYTKTQKLYGENNRVKELKLVFITESGRIQKYLTLKDEYNIEQEISYDEPIENVSGMEFYVQNIYPGNAYNDTCISDIYFYGTNNKRIEFVK